MSRAITLAIDGEKLRRMIEATGRTLPDASEEIGGSRKYLGGICRDGKITAQCTNLIELAFQIPKDLYLIREEPEPEAPEQEPQTITELLTQIRDSLDQVLQYLREERNEQKTFNLPFGGPADNHRDDHDLHNQRREVD